MNTTLYTTTIYYRRGQLSFRRFYARKRFIFPSKLKNKITWWCQRPSEELLGVVKAEHIVVILHVVLREQRVHFLFSIAVQSTKHERKKMGQGGRWGITTHNKERVFMKTSPVIGWVADRVMHCLIDWLPVWPPADYPPWWWTGWGMISTEQNCHDPSRAVTRIETWANVPQMN